MKPTTWIARGGRDDSSPARLYILGLYWALQTITTVGYGDFGSGNTLELVITTIWMCIGVAFYSFAVGAITSTIVSASANGDELMVGVPATKNYIGQTESDRRLQETDWAR